MTFSDLNIDDDIVAALASKGILEPFPIQEQTIPLALQKQDIIGQAKTGTGKTFGFGLPLIQALGTDPEPGVKALIVVPTRELAVQVTEDIELAASNRPTKIVSIYGGKAYEGQIEQLKAGAQIVVGTPGRLLDLAGQRLLSLANVQVMVLDEADKMLDLGFLSDIEKLFAQTPANRHTMLFSATMPGAIVALARRFMNRPIHIRATDPDEGITQANIKHIVYRAHSLDKDEVIARILQSEGRGKTVIFTRTKRAAARIVEELNDRGFNAAAVHGDLNQEQRERAMAAFKAGKKDILIATDVAARGIDVNDVTHVINHTIPDDDQTYLHRVGRTGRAGKTGIAVTFVDWEDLHKWALINRALEFGQPDPVETYSSSPHLYTDLDIPAGTKGRLKPTPIPAEAKADARPERSTRQREPREPRRRSAEVSRPAGRPGPVEREQGHHDGNSAPRRRTRSRNRAPRPDAGLTHRTAPRDPRGGALSAAGGVADRVDRRPAGRVLTQPVRLARAVVVARARGDQRVALGELEEPPPAVAGVLAVLDLETEEPRLDELGEHPLDGDPPRAGRRVRDHRDSARGADEAHGVHRVEGVVRLEVAAAPVEDPRERGGAVGGEPARDQGVGDVRAPDRGAGARPERARRPRSGRSRRRSRSRSPRRGGPAPSGCAWSRRGAPDPPDRRGTRGRARSPSRPARTAPCPAPARYRRPPPPRSRPASPPSSRGRSGRLRRAPPRPPLAPGPRGLRAVRDEGVGVEVEPASRDMHALHRRRAPTGPGAWMA
ncbi:DEAD/DEAH box helicase [Rathayibacter oskolensis]|uniref:DEAD/DEAH box helicase n=1 Tax=Rathayibacter oskolensis TaxID=1891671 RepID=UPI00265E6C4B|nr:DEAD/DEAH box helicase [Rathayibacter oskolensis]WKK70940.1 DEAD/DEAH box helicase [Rathayibacter oskolensis]